MRRREAMCGRYVLHGPKSSWQARGAGIEGGEVHHLSKGDVITIPAKLGAVD